MEKITPRKFIDQMYPQFKNITDNELSSNINGDAILSLMEDYYMYKRILEKTEGGKNANNYDEYH